MIKALKWISVIGLVLTIIGVVTISMAIRAYPQSNLLGGWGMILGPIYWLGLLLCLVAVLGWFVLGINWVIRSLKRMPKKDSDKLNQ